MDDQNKQLNRMERFLYALETSGTVVFNQDIALRYTDILNTHPGFEGKDILGKRDEDLLPAEEARVLTEIKQRVIQTGVREKAEVVTTIGGDNHYYYLLVVWPLRDEQGSIIGVSCSSTDISDRKKAEIALAESEEKYRQLFNLVSDPLFVMDLNTGMIKEVNEAAVKTYGFTREEMLLKKVFEFSAEPEKTAQAILDKLDYIPVRYHYKKDGTIFPVEISSRDYILFDHSVRIASIRDITERLRTYEELQRSQRLESLGILSGGIAHDFNNLLTGIFGYVEMALEAVVSEQAAAHLVKAMRTIDRARALTQQLLTFAKGDAPTMKTDALFPFIKDTAMFALSGSNCSCRFSLSGGLWYCRYDKSQIAQVVDNLLRNARESMPEGGLIEISAENRTIRAGEKANLPPGDYVVLSFKDQGTGIPMEIRNKIFDPFFTSKSKGHGLGLSICHSIIKRHGGILELDSVQGQGSTFHVYLPASPEAIASSKTAPLIPDANGRGGMILVLDDEEIVRDVLSNLLISMGFQVVSFKNGNDILNFFTKEKQAGRELAAIILDLTIPGEMGGKDVIQQIRRLDTEIPVFVSSGYSEDAAVQNPASFGFTASIRKPFSINDLKQMLFSHLK